MTIALKPSSRRRAACSEGPGPDSAAPTRVRAARPEVDGTKIGITGRSGGGNSAR